jgi:FKBP-type peptidyl-prolyl cis-trans isomerase
MGTDLKVKHNWRDGIFRQLFKEEENFVNMYEVFTGKKLLPEEVEFRDTDSIVLSKDLKNDLSFVTKDGDFIILVEHQHSKNPNIGLRMLIYYAELLKIHIKKNELNIYGVAPINYPNSEFYVAYTGKKPWLENLDVIAGDVTISAKLIDINYDKLEIKEKDNTLSGYAYLLKQFEYYRDDEELGPRVAVDQAFADCRREGYLIDYVDREEFLTMVTEVWTIEQQAIDRERWAREEEQAKAEQQAVDRERWVREEEQAKAADRERWAREEEQAKAADRERSAREEEHAKAADRERWAREEEQAKAEQQAVDRGRSAREEEKMNIVKRLLSMGLPNSDVAQGAGVDIDAVLKVSQENCFEE